MEGVVMLATIGLLIAVYVIVRGIDIAFTHIVRAWPNAGWMVAAAVIMALLGIALTIYGVASFQDITKQATEMTKNMPF